MEDFTRLYEISHLNSNPKHDCARPTRILSDMAAAISTFITIFFMYSTTEFQNHSQNLTSSMWVLSIAAYIIYVCVNHLFPSVLATQYVSDLGFCVFWIHSRSKKAYGYVPFDILLVNLYRTLPLRTVSRCWGSVNSLDVPLFLRKPLYGLYSKLFNVNIDDAENPDLTSYSNLQAFFTRNLKANVREICSQDLTSPCDGRVLYHGKVENSQVEQIKGVSYSLKLFLGPNSWNSSSNVVSHEASDEKYHTSLGIQPGNDLFHVVIYLAPGDYHQFHSPANWTVDHRRHFPGDLFSVNPGVAKLIKGLFNFNERVVLLGKWKHGLFSMTAVGATNVGSIDLTFDKDLKTNCRGRYKKGDFKDYSYVSKDVDELPCGICLKKGEVCGKFNLGSTIVLIFEAPSNFQFCIMPGQRLKLGQQLGSL